MQADTRKGWIIAGAVAGIVVVLGLVATVTLVACLPGGQGDDAARAETPRQKPRPPVPATIAEAPPDPQVPPPAQGQIPTPEPEPDTGGAPPARAVQSPPAEAATAEQFPAAAAQPQRAATAPETEAPTDQPETVHGLTAAEILQKIQAHDNDGDRYWEARMHYLHFPSRRDCGVFTSPALAKWAEANQEELMEIPIARSVQYSEAIHRATDPHQRTLLTSEHMSFLLYMADTSESLDWSFWQNQVLDEQVKRGQVEKAFERGGLIYRRLFQWSHESLMQDVGEDGQLTGPDDPRLSMRTKKLLFALVDVILKAYELREKYGLVVEMPPNVPKAFNIAWQTLGLSVSGEATEPPTARPGR